MPDVNNPTCRRHLLPYRTARQATACVISTSSSRHPEAKRYANIGSDICGCVWISVVGRYCGRDQSPAGDACYRGRGAATRQLQLVFGHARGTLAGVSLHVGAKLFHLAGTWPHHSGGHCYRLLRVWLCSDRRGLCDYRSSLEAREASANSISLIRSRPQQSSSTSRSPHDRMVLVEINNGGRNLKSANCYVTTNSYRGVCRSRSMGRTFLRTVSV